MTAVSSASSSTATALPDLKLYKLSFIEEVAAFVELFAKKGALSTTQIEAYRQRLRDQVPALSTNALPTKEEICTLHTRVHAAIQRALDKSKDSKKPLLVLTGEHHLSRRSLIAEFIILHTISALGFKNFLLEISDYETIEKYREYCSKKEPYIMQTAEISYTDVCGFNFLFCANLAEKLAMKIIPYNIKSKDKEKRIEAMTQIIFDVGENSIALGGSAHLHHFATNKNLCERYELCIINTSELQALKISDDWAEERRLSLDLDNVIHAVVPGNPYSLTIQEMYHLVQSSISPT